MKVFDECNNRSGGGGGGGIWAKVARPSFAALRRPNGQLGGGLCELACQQQDIHTRCYIADATSGRNDANTLTHLRHSANCFAAPVAAAAAACSDRRRRRRCCCCNKNTRPIKTLKSPSRQKSFLSARALVSKRAADNQLGSGVVGGGRQNCSRQPRE